MRFYAELVVKTKQRFSLLFVLLANVNDTSIALMSDTAFDSYTRNLNHRLEQRSPAWSQSQPAMSKLGRRLEEAQEIDESLNKSRKKYAVLAAPAADGLARSLAAGVGAGGSGPPPRRHPARPASSRPGPGTLQVAEHPPERRRRAKELLTNSA